MGALGTPVSRDVVSQLLRQHGYRRRKALKKKTMGHHRDRNAQFEKIARLKKKYLKAGLPVISIDTKKKELLGDFYRDGKIEAQGTIETNDHDFGSAGSGTVIPHGVYDVGKNRGFLHLNTSHDTSELACDSIAAWWEEHGPVGLPRGEEDPGPVRRRGQQQCDEVRVQGGAPEAGGPTRAGDPRGALPAVLLEVQPDRAPAVPARDAGLPRGDLPDAGDGAALHGEDQHAHRPDGQGEDPREGLRDGPQVCRGVQGVDEDRLRQDPAEVELSRDPEPDMKPGSYSRPVPKPPFIDHQ